MTTERYRYVYQGIHIDSDVPVPDWEDFGDPGAGQQPDVTISTVARLPKPAAEPDPAREHRFYARDSGWIRISGGREIQIAPDEGKMTRRLRTFLTGTAWGVLQYQRGTLLIHASSFETGHGAIMLCGRGGYGKSTLAAFSEAHGYRLVSDDLCPVILDQSATAHVHPSSRRLRLWADTINALGWTGDHEVDYFRPGKFYCVRIPRVTASPSRLKAIYLLEWGEQEQIQPVRGFDALNRLVSAATWRPRLLMSCGDPARHFHGCAELVSRVPVREFRRRKDLSAIPGHIDLLARDSGQIGR